MISGVKINALAKILLTTCTINTVRLVFCDFNYPVLARLVVFESGLGHECGLESVFAGLGPGLELGSKRLGLGLGLGTIGFGLGTERTRTYSLSGPPIQN